MLGVSARDHLRLRRGLNMARIVPGSPQWQDSLERLLDLLEEEIALFGEGGEPDYDTIQAVVQYFLNHLEIPRYEDRHAPAQKPLGAARENGGTTGSSTPQSAGLAPQFALLVQEVLSGAEVPRDRLVGTAREFIEYQRHELRTTIPFRIVHDPRISRALGLSI